MSKLLNISIDVNKINKERLIQGKKGTYLNLTVEVKDQKDQFDNDVSCWEAQTAEERSAKAERNYLGNGRIVWSGSSNPKPDDVPNIPTSDESDNLPF